MKQFLIRLLKILVVLIGFVVFSWLVIFPKLEGRAANLDLISIYADPLIIYAYFAAIPFYIALYQTYRLLSYIQKKLYPSAIRSLAIIRYCAITSIGFIAGGETIIFLTSTEPDKAGIFALGIYLSLISAIFAAITKVIEKILQSKIKSKK